MPNLLKKMIKDQIIEGDFTLASGKTSKYYCDLRKLTLDPIGFKLVGSEMSDLLRNVMADSVGGLAIAAIPVVCSIIDYSGMRGFIVRKEIKDHGTGKMVEGCLQPNDRVIILDDVGTTGNSILQAINIVREHYGASVVAAAVILNREEGIDELMAEQNIPFYYFATLKELTDS